jgi:hypothetical protein
MLRGHRGRAEHQSGDDDRGHRVETGSRSPNRRARILGGSSPRASQVDEHVQAEKDEPHDRRRAVKAAGELERLPVQEPHRDAAAEEDHRRRHEQRREQAHRDLRRAFRDVRAAARVVAGEPPGGARELQQNRRDQREADEDVQRHERVHAEQDGSDLDEHRHDHEQADRGGQARIPGRVHRSHLGVLTRPRLIVRSLVRGRLAM